MRDAVDVEHAPCPDRNSSLTGKGNCIPLALYRLIGSPDLLRILESSIGPVDSSRPKVRSYRECLRLIGYGRLVYTESSKLEPGMRCLIHADGRGDEPHCFSMQIDSDGKTKISSGRTTYVYTLRGARDVLDASIDRPVILLFDADESQSAGSIGTTPSHDFDDVTDLKAGNQ